MPEPTDSSQRECIRNEVSRVHESAVFSAQGQFEAAKGWRALHWCLGGLTAALSAFAAVLTFASNAQVLTGILAVAAALAAAILTSSRPDRLAERAEAKANGYTTLRNDARRLHHIHVPHDPIPSLQQALDALAARASDLDHTSDPIPRFAYKKAKRNIEHEGGQRFGVDTA
ncbi:SLATT domain-containing protein [Nocardiopsis dassonvillei]|uniref:SLATT domain-containing protein n=1 Tax=Nocardiopsis dassonvillei TaxID=2014 RepID=UPI00200DB031|nr:SLATT domain-containing protein [Nocardiopsis dassonvillei]MCK9873912.1 SLATT domain-containing protein [Nocardiopsis dassonvillei]